MRTKLFTLRNFGLWPLLGIVNLYHVHNHLFTRHILYCLATASPLRTGLFFCAHCIHCELRAQRAQRGGGGVEAGCAGKPTNAGRWELNTAARIAPGPEPSALYFRTLAEEAPALKLKFKLISLPGASTRIAGRTLRIPRHKACLLGSSPAVLNAATSPNM